MTAPVLGMCDKRQYEHNGPHPQISECGQNIPPFPCVNWHPVIAKPIVEAGGESQPESVELPPLDTSRADIEESRQRPPNCGVVRDGVTMTYSADATIICRERQLREAIAARDAVRRELSAAKAEHGKTLLLLHKAAFETIPQLEATLSAIRSAEVPEVSSLARTIVSRITENAIRAQWTRTIWELEGNDLAEWPTEESMVQDALSLALGDDTGCLSEEDEDFRERVDVLWLEDLLVERLSPKASEGGTDANQS